jgi:hypothetical protein
MSYRGSLDMLSHAIHMNDAHAKVVEVILQAGPHFASRSVAG